MVPKDRKCNLWIFKDNLQASINAKSVSCQPTQKDIGLVVASSLYWTDNYHQRTEKATSALHQIKKNLSKIMYAQNASQFICWLLCSNPCVCSQDWSLHTIMQKEI